MIILDSETQKPPLANRAPSVLSNASNADSLLSSDIRPPSYRSQGSRHSIQPMCDDRPPSISDVDADIPVKVKRRFKRLEQGWCWKGLLYVLAAYAVISIAVAVPYFVTHRNSSSDTTPSYNRMNGKGNDSDGVDPSVITPPNIPPEDGIVKACDAWDDTYAYGYPDTTEASRLTYSIPSNASNLWLRSLGKIPGLKSGQLNVFLNPDETQTQYLISVTVTYSVNNYNSRNSTAICLMQSNQTWGIGFYPFSSKPWNLSLQYQIDMYMPQPDDKNYTLSQFSLGLPGFSHSFQDLEEYVAFDNVNISGASSSVDGILSAKAISISTSQASITGNYSTSQSLFLQTSSGIIDTDITLASGTDDNNPTNLSIQSAQGPISARIALSGPLTSNTASSISSNPPRFKTEIIGVDSAVTIMLNHTDDLLFSELDLNINTTFNRALVLLDENFEGSFTLRSVNGSILVADIDATANFNGDSLDGSFPTSTYYRRSLDIHSYSSTELHGHVRRDTGSSSTGQVNVQVQNHLALVAFGFFQTGDPNPTIAELGMQL